MSPKPTVWKCCIQKPNVTINTCYNILETNLSNGKKYVSIPRSFLVINICNQGKTLCTTCKLLRFLFATGVAQRFSLLYSGFSFLRIRSYTQRRTTVGRTSLDEWPARQRDLFLTKHTKPTTDKFPCLRWDSNPRSQQANVRRNTP